ncbi:hypothetical protein [Escherichia coli]|uniref:hypothetical protein n=2 Tax=Escherichia coli TaxID=562 RepID=UPI000E5B6C55|nr:hypothetical protein [Escherichia coli]EFB3214535.1 hypothetical protein [Escherichia coli]EFF9741880.1 hypothetical protein [Escherichia coli]EFG7260091.1 hypothetical protein [Escherichia coli]EFH7507883.1 hypothetical protein [Escherichia coli]EJZ9677511.1 hypothetical protein [Escherichia coli]
MKRVIAIILMVLAGNCFADLGDYSLAKEDTAKFESVVIENCAKSAKTVGGDDLARLEVEYVAAVCAPMAMAIIYDRFDDIRAIPYKVSLKSVLDEDGNQKINVLNKMGVLAGRIVAEQYLGMNYE